MRTSRRSILLATSSIGLTASAGCTGLLENPNEDMQDSSSTRSGSSAVNTETEEPENSVSSQEIVETYNDGMGAQNDAMNNLNSAINEANNDLNAQAEDSASSAEADFGRTKDHFSDAHTLTLQTENVQAQSVCEDAVTYASRMEGAAKAVKRAAQASQRDDPSSANDHIETFRNRQQRADEIDVKDPGELENILE